MKLTIKILCLIIAFFCVTSTVALEANRSNLTIEKIQAVGPSTNTYEEDTLWIYVNAPDWSTISCDATWLRIDAEQHPQMAALLLSAYHAGETLRTYVNDGYITNGYCNIIKARMEK